MTSKEFGIYAVLIFAIFVAGVISIKYADTMYDKGYYEGQAEIYKHFSHVYMPFPSGDGVPMDTTDHGR